MTSRRVGELEQCRTFEDLIQRIDATIRRIKYVGDLTIYDTALRIGAKLGLEPTLVYLHAGTREGARVLGIDPRRKTVESSELPVPFRRLRPRETEDCLCIYADDLRRINRGADHVRRDA